MTDYSLLIGKMVLVNQSVGMKNYQRPLWLERVESSEIMFTHTHPLIPFWPPFPISKDEIISIQELVVKEAQ